ncbi:MAG: LamG domain-containing protein [Candidatus Micrarchaeia archaeon]
MATTAHKISVRHFTIEYRKAQSAMEYLMTYGWAILIIAVVLGALFQLGVFSSNNFEPKATPGSCDVFRSAATGASQVVSLEGMCGGELPEYTAQFGGAGYIQFGTPISLVNSGTITAWILPTSFSGNPVILGNGAGAPVMLFVVSPNDLALSAIQSGSQVIENSGVSIPPNIWTFVAVTFGPSGTVFYVNGAAASSSSTPTSGASFIPTIGWGGSSTSYWNGDIANIQVYNTTLSAANIGMLYTQGIGAAPTRLQNLVAWWPLNGNANDYSGFGNDGTPSNVLFTGTWWRQYIKT